MLDCSLILACVRLHCGHLAAHLAVSRRRLADLLVKPVSQRRLASRLHTAPILGIRVAVSRLLETVHAHTIRTTTRPHRRWRAAIPFRSLLRMVSRVMREPFPARLETSV